MSTLTDHGLVCLTDEDYSAVPLAMQADATAVTEATASQSASLTAYNNRPWLLATSTVAVTGAQSLTEPSYNTSFPGLTVMTQTSGTVQQSGMASFTSSVPEPAGWYHVGGFATFQATGAVNTFTRRLLAVQWFHIENLTNVYETAIQTCYESNTGGDAMTVQGMFYADGVNSYTATLYFAHRNSSSTMQVNTGAKLWITYLGSGVNI